MRLYIKLRINCFRPITSVICYTSFDGLNHCMYVNSKYGNDFKDDVLHRSLSPGSGCGMDFVSVHCHKDWRVLSVDYAVSARQIEPLHML